MKWRWPKYKPAGPAHPVSTVSAHVKRLGQFFNSLDPSPFWDRDLDKDAAEFVEAEFRDRPRDRAWVLNVTTVDAEGYVERDVQEAVRHYYQRSVDSIRWQTRERNRIDRLALAVGVGVFGACMLGRELVGKALTERLPTLLDEGLIVLAWIALWLPIEHFVYDVVPLIRDRRFYEALAQLRVRVHLEKPSAGAAP